MLNLINSSFAQEVTQTIAKQPSQWTSMIPLVLIMVVFYFLLIRPQQKKMKEHQLLVKSITKGDNVITTGGIYGEVAKVEEGSSIVHLIISDNVTIKIRQDMISEIINKEAKIVTPVSPIVNRKLSKTKAKRK